MQVESKTLKKRITASEGAAMLGMTPSVFYRKMKRHGVNKAADGTFSLEQVKRAELVGKEMDKSKLESEVETSDSLPAQKMKKQIEKLEIDISKGRAELEQITGDLVPVEEMAHRLGRLLSDMAQRAKTWKESTIAKSPHLRKEIDEAFRVLQTSMAEASID